MDIQIAAVGGYEEVGRNMTAVRVGDDVVVFDMGLDVAPVVREGIDVEHAGRRELIDAGAIPDDSVVADLDGEVCAIVFSHGHLDHVGAAGVLAERYDAPLIASPFTMEILKGELDPGYDGDLVTMAAGEVTALGDDLDLEFVHVTHSTVGAVNPVLHTPEGAVVYGLDKRLDHDPVLEPPIDMARFAELGEAGVLAYVEDCTNAGRSGRTPGEAVARARVRDVLGSVADAPGVIVASTFASHVARVSGVVETAREIGREPILLGRSMATYARTAAHFDYPGFGDVEAHGTRVGIERALRRVRTEGRDSFLLLATGHQGEPNAVLPRLARGDGALALGADDVVVFGARVIPDPINRRQRATLDRRLARRGTEVHEDVHVSGHLSAAGHRRMRRTLEPRTLIPAHQSVGGIERYVALAEADGYERGEDVHVARNGTIIQLSS
ncbi:ribonuclease J [Halarchaeum solikamskense]|uniref:MBL fold metallo-hydrolase n=1 Tax=Halarchaeum nitratireducens TaxID=489913 RepID=UPI001B3AC972|nr:MBL fold metallo-hydrolase [Halarchaeum solikamskense]MBP2251695.1 ribonuclease J [Halarchaeum solikamskense]